MRPTKRPAGRFTPERQPERIECRIPLHQIRETLDRTAISTTKQILDLNVLEAGVEASSALAHMKQSPAVHHRLRARLETKSRQRWKVDPA